MVVDGIGRGRGLQAAWTVLGAVLGRLTWMQETATILVWTGFRDGQEQGDESLSGWGCDSVRKVHYHGNAVVRVARGSGLSLTPHISGIRGCRDEEP